MSKVHVWQCLGGCEVTQTGGRRVQLMKTYFDKGTCARMAAGHSAKTGHLVMWFSVEQGNVLTGDRHLLYKRCT